MRKIVSKWRTPFIGTRHRRHTLPATTHCTFSSVFFSSLSLSFRFNDTSDHTFVLFFFEGWKSSQAWQRKERQNLWSSLAYGHLSWCFFSLSSISAYVYALFLDSNNIHSRIVADDVHPINKSSTSPRLSIDSRTHPSTSFYSMQTTTSSSNLGATGTGIVPPPMHSQQSMQSTTPSIANGKDEMRGWLYKWTNVNLHRLKFSIVSFVLLLVSQRLSKTLVCLACWHSFLLSFSRWNDTHLPWNSLPRICSFIFQWFMSFRYFQWFNSYSSSNIEWKR